MRFDSGRAGCETGSSFNWPQAQQKLLCRDTDELSFGLDVQQFGGVNLTLEDGFYKLTQFKIKPSLSFHMTIGAIDHASPDSARTQIGLGVEKMPDNLALTIGLDGIIKMLSTSIKADGAPVSHIGILVDAPGWPGYDIALDGIPAGAEIGLAAMAGSATLNRLSLPSGVILGGWRVTMFSDATHYLSASYGNARWFDWEADFDGSNDYPGTPHFLDIRTPGIGRMSIQAQWGNYGLNVDGSNIATSAVLGAITATTVLVGVYHKAVDGVSVVIDATERAGSMVGSWITEHGGAWELPAGFW